MSRTGSIRHLFAVMCLAVFGCVVPDTPWPGVYDRSDFEHFGYREAAVWGLPDAGEVVFATIDREDDGRYLLRLAIQDDVEPEDECWLETQDLPDDPPPCSTELPSRYLSDDEVAEMAQLFSVIRLAWASPFICAEPTSIGYYEWDDFEVNDWPFSCGLLMPYLDNASDVRQFLEDLRDSD